MKVFLSWSGDSRPIADALHDWLPQVLHAVRPWKSDEDIGKGVFSQAEIGEALRTAGFGIVCLTATNHQSPWLNFEAGALAAGLSGARVTPLLIDLRPSELRGPLSDFQMTEATESDLFRLIRDLNDLLDEESRLDHERLRRSFEQFWPGLDAELAAIRVSLEADPQDQSRRDPTSAVDDLVVVSKDIQRHLHEVSDQLTVALTRSALDPAASQGALAETFALRERKQFPPLRDRLATASRAIWFLGQTLRDVTSTYLDSLVEVTGRGVDLRFLLLTPYDRDAVAVAARSLYSITDASDLLGELRASLDSIATLQSHTRSGSSVEVRLTSTIPAFAVSAIDPTTPGAGSLAVELYPFRVTASRRPLFSVSYGDPWYEYFVAQYEDLWRYADPSPGIHRSVGDQ